MLNYMEADQHVSNLKDCINAAESYFLLSKRCLNSDDVSTADVYLDIARHLCKAVYSIEHLLCWEDIRIPLSIIDDIDRVGNDIFGGIEDESDAD